MIRLVDLQGRHAEVADAAEDAVLEVLRSGQYVGGARVRPAEAEAARRFGRRHAVGVNSGTDALMLALQAVGVRAGDEVIVPAISFFASAGAVVSIGAVPVFADVREDACLDPDAAAALRTERTAAIVPVHLYGTLAAAPDLGVPVVDDAAQAVGGDPVRAVGHLTVVSTYPTKTWGGAGDGGFVLGDDAELVDRARRLANHGAEDGGFHEVDGLVGRNSRLDAVQAALLLAHAPRVAPRVARRRAIAARYDAELPPAVRPLPRDPGSPVAQYVVRVADRDRVHRALSERGIETRAYYRRPLHHEPALSRAEADTPVAAALCRELLALPCHAGLTDADVAQVLRALQEVA